MRLSIKKCYLRHIETLIVVIYATTENKIVLYHVGNLHQTFNFNYWNLPDKIFNRTHISHGILQC